jgi:hypothetical protein
MKPDWRRFVTGVLAVIFAYLGLVLSGLDIRLLDYFSDLPAGRASWAGAAITLSLMLLSAALGFVLAKRRRRRPLAWLCVCFLFNVWGLIYLWSLPTMSGQARK